MRTADLDYVLPPDLVAHRPPEARDGGRLLVVGERESTGPQSDPRGDLQSVERAGGHGLRDARILDLVELIPPGALLVVNDTRVVRARLLGHRETTGGRVEIFLLAPIPDASPTTDVSSCSSGSKRAKTARYEALGRASKTLQVGATIAIEGGELRVTIRARAASGATLEVELSSLGDSSVIEAIERVGHMPLPPYVERADDETDAERYQTVYARNPGAVAAPTAGLHLSEPLLAQLRARDVQIASCTLHVGLGTFQPVAVDDLDDHPMHTESLEVSSDLAAAIDAARARRAPVVAVGTTVVRALESSADPDRQGAVLPRSGETRLLIQPGYAFRVVDALLTNFHLPRSTLLALVQAFGGRAALRAAYDHAIAERYRFYSYGDAMFIAHRASPQTP